MNQDITHTSSVPDREFERPTTIEHVRDLARLGTEIVYRVIQYVGVSDDDIWKILRAAQIACCEAHGFICEARFVGIPEWKKKASAA